jgi:ubiquinone/menaquinone biosynthesis C-methylase UbiE
MFDLSKPDQFKQLVRSSFDVTHPGYGTDGDFHWQFASRLVAHAPLQPGQVIVDVATGTAPAAIQVASSVGDGGRVFGLDLSDCMLALARRNLDFAGIANVDLLSGDAERLPLPANSVDGLICSSAIIWLPDIPRALNDWHRVLRDGAWIAFSCFGGLARQTVIGLLGRVLQPFGQYLPEITARLNSPEKCLQLLDAAGFAGSIVYRGQDRPLPYTGEESFEWAMVNQKRFRISLTVEQLAQVQIQYIAGLNQIKEDRDRWNHDYEQFVVAYK